MVLLFKNASMNKILRRDKLDILLLILFFSFSWWLMNKSFGYDTSAHIFRIARHQIGDFGLHISLIRSFSWGNNFPVESPFYPGVPLPYHYYFDLLVGLLEKTGVSIALAFNGLSVIFFTLLLWLIYKLPQLIFAQGRMIGILSVILFIFHSNLTFIDFFKGKTWSISLFKELWYLPDYIHKGPFDGSIISIFFTMNVFLNQRHLIAGLAISLGLLYVLLQRLLNSRNLSMQFVILIGIILGFSSRVHTLIFFSTVVIVINIFVLFRQVKYIVPFLFSVFLLFAFHFLDISHQQSHQLINLGFLSTKPISIKNFLSFWFMNLGIAIFIIPIGFFLSGKKHKFFFLSFLPLFIIGNVFQPSFIIEHNHSLFNYFIILANFYISFVLIKLWKKKTFGKILVIVLFFLLTISGFIDLFAIKNDYQYMLKDAPNNKFIRWIKDNTVKRDVFLARKEILDPVTFSGRRNYLGHVFDMGYDTSAREKIVKTIFEAQDKNIFEKAKKDGIQYIIIPNNNIVDFNYIVHREFFKNNLSSVYEDEQVTVFKL